MIFPSVPRKAKYLLSGEINECSKLFSSLPEYGNEFSEYKRKAAVPMNPGTFVIFPVITS